MSRPREESIGSDAKKFLVMRTLARLHECDEQALLHGIDATEPELQDLITEMISNNEVEASPAGTSRGKLRMTFALTLKGWSEYMNALGSVYELPE